MARGPFHHELLLNVDLHVWLGDCARTGKHAAVSTRRASRQAAVARTAHRQLGRMHVRVCERLWHAPVLATQGLTVEAV